MGKPVLVAHITITLWNDSCFGAKLDDASLLAASFRSWYTHFCFKHRQP
jgi:hypothetical protein